MLGLAQLLLCAVGCDVVRRKAAVGRAVSWIGARLSIQLALSLPWVLFTLAEEGSWT